MSDDSELPLSPELVLVSPDLRDAALRAASGPARWDCRRSPASTSHRAPASGAWRPEQAARRHAALALSAALLFFAGISVGRLASHDSTAVVRRAAVPTSPFPAAMPATTTPGRAVAEAEPELPVLPLGRTAATNASRQLRATSPAKPVFQGQSRDRPSTVEQERTTSSSSPPQGAGPGQTKAPIAVPNAGYVLANGHFQMTDDARTIVHFALQSRCSGLLALPPIDVDATGVFGFTGHPSGSPAGTSVRIIGRFVSSTKARGTTQVRRGGCRDPALAFVARLS